MAVVLPHDNTIRGRLLNVERELFSAQEDDDFDAFGQRWTQLQRDILEHREEDPSLQRDTDELAYSVAGTIEAVCKAMMDLDVAHESLLAGIESGCTEILSGDGPDLPPSSPSPREQSPPTYTATPGIVPYIEPAYRWLLQNLHNPYPPQITRDAFSKQTSSRRKDIDAWFTDARRRIGWNALRKARFPTRKQMIDSATRFFSKPDPKRRLEADIEAEFARIKLQAMDLYTEKLDNSKLALKMAGAVKDMTPELRLQAKQDMRRRKAEKKAAAAAAASYPSPARSPSCTPEPTIPVPPLAQDEHDIIASTPAGNGRKRRADSEERDEAQTSRPNKRTRSNDDGGVASLPSPSPSSHEHLHETGGDSETTSSQPRSRKRRLSDADSQAPPKRFCGQPNALLRSVSDPTPLSSITSDVDFSLWFESLCDPNNSVLDSPQSVDVSVYDYSALSPSTISESSTPELLTPVLPQQLLVDIPESESTTASEHFYAGLDFSSSPLESSNLNVEFDWSLLSNEINLPTETTLLPALEPSLAPPTSSSTQSSDDRSMEEFLQIINAPQTYDSAQIVDTSFPAYDAPGTMASYPYITPQSLLASIPPADLPSSDQFSTYSFEPSMSMLGAFSKADFSSMASLEVHDKQEKLRKLQELKDSVRQLEQEVQALP